MQAEQQQVLEEQQQYDGEAVEGDDDMELTVSFQSIEILQEHGIAANDIQKLQNAGYHTVESVRLNDFSPCSVCDCAQYPNFEINSKTQTRSKSSNNFFCFI